MMLRLKISLVVLMSSVMLVSGSGIEVQSVVVAGVGQDAIFRCASLDAVDIEWLINGTALTNFQLRNVVGSFDSIGRTGALQFPNVSAEYNGTIVQCIVVTTSGTVQAPNSTLLLQGTLSAVGNLEVSNIDDSTVFLNWTAPFTLDISLIDLDITYCVDVVSSTSSATLHSACGITETEFTSPSPPRSWCDTFIFTVTPVNVVGNGTKRSKSYVMQNLLVPNNIVEVTRLNAIHTIVMSAPVCTASLRCVDLDDAEGTRDIENADLTISETNVTFTSQQLTQNRRYALSITASNIRGSGAATSPQEDILSTHDITECSTDMNSTGVEVFVRFIEKSEASGALLVFIFMEGEEIDFSKSLVRAVDKDDLSNGHMIPMDDFYPGNYEAFFYDIESDNKIQNGSAYQASRGNFIVDRDQEPIVSPRISNCSVDSLNDVIEVSCPFDFQVAVQSSDINVVANLQVHTSTNSDPVTISVENGMYFITVLRIGENGIMSELPFSHVEMVTDVPTTQATEAPDTPSITALAIAATVSVICLALLMTVIAALILLKSRKKVSRPIMFIEGEGIHRTCSISYQRKSGSTVFATIEMYDAHSIAGDARQEEATEHDMNHPATTASSSSFSIQEENSKPDDFSGHVYSVVNKAKKTHTPTSTTVVEPVTSSTNTVGDSYLLVAGGTEGTQPCQTFAEPTNTEGGHYSTLDHRATRPAEINPSCEDSKYSVPMKYQNPHGQQYALLQLKNSTKTGDECLEISRSVVNVVYSEVQPAPNMLKGPQPRDGDDDTPVPSQQDEAQMQDGNGTGDPFRWYDHDEKTPLIAFDSNQVF